MRPTDAKKSLLGFTSLPKKIVTKAAVKYRTQRQTENKPKLTKKTVQTTEKQRKALEHLTLN